MSKQANNLLQSLREDKIPFSEVIATIDSAYNHTPTAFKNGEAFNQSDQNQGSAKVFSFAKLSELSKEETLSLFAEHYQLVLDSPDANDHQNIRQFMQHGWEGITFEGEALSVK